MFCSLTVNLFPDAGCRPRILLVSASYSFLPHVQKISLHPHYPVKLSHLMIIKEISSLIRCRDVSVDSSVQNLNFVFLYESFSKKRSSYRLVMENRSDTANMSWSWVWSFSVSDFELSYTFCIMAFWLYGNYSSGF